MLFFQLTWLRENRIKTGLTQIPMLRNFLSKSHGSHRKSLSLQEKLIIQAMA